MKGQVTVNYNVKDEKTSENQKCFYRQPFIRILCKRLLIMSRSFKTDSEAESEQDIVVTVNRNVTQHH